MRHSSLKVEPTNLGHWRKPIFRLTLLSAQSGESIRSRNRREILNDFVRPRFHSFEALMATSEPRQSV